jgi:hypothetical protein
MPKVFPNAFFVLVAGLLIGAAEARAEKFKAILRRVDPAERTLHVTRAEPPDDKEIRFAVVPNARIIRGNGQKPLADGLRDKLFVAGAQVTLTTRTENGIEVVTKVAVYGRSSPP